MLHILDRNEMTQPSFNFITLKWFFLSLSRGKNTLSRSYWQGSLISTFTFHMINHKICKMIISLTSTLRWVTRPSPDKIMEKQTLKMTNGLHDGKRKHICNQCNYSTNRTSSLKKHKLVHSGEKPFACSQCKYSCTEAGRLKTHLLTHSGEKPFACSQCKYSCNRADSLKTHLLIHSGENPFKCRHCNYSFK